MSGKGRDSDDKSGALLCCFQGCTTATFSSQILDCVLVVFLALVTESPAAQHRVFVLVLHRVSGRFSPVRPARCADNKPLAQANGRRAD